MAFGSIKGEESSTTTFKARTITQTQNSTVMHQEIISLGDVGSSLGVARVLDSAPASTEFGLAVRQVGYSTVVSVAALPANSSQVDVRALPTGVLSTATPAAGSTGVNVYLVNQSTTVSVANAVTVTAAFSKSEDAAAQDGDFGVPAMAVRKATPGNTSGSDGDYEFLQVSSGRLWASAELTAFPAGMVSSAAPAASDTGLFVRQIGYSTIVSVAALPANSSQVEVRSGSLSSISSIAGVVTVTPNSTGWVKSAGLSVDSSNYLNVNASFTGSTQVEVRGLPSGMVSSAAPAANDTGLFVRVIGYSTIVTVAAMPAGSTTVTVAAMPAGSTTVSVAALPANSSQVEVRALPANTSNVAVTAFPSGLLSTLAPSSNSSGLIVRQVIVGPQTFASTGAFTTSTLAAVNSTVTGQKCKVFAYSITSTDAGPSELAFYKGSSMVWPVVLAAVSSAISGANLAVSPPAYLFATAAGSSMTLRISGSSRAGWRVGVSYFMEP